MNKQIRFAIICIFSCLFFTVNSQDLHYSQFYNSPQNINPASSGVFNGDHRFVLSLRDQWRFVPVPWFTISGSYDRQIYFPKNEKHFLGVGANFNHDRQGDGRLNLSQLNLNVAYHRILHPSHIISGGILIGFASRGFNSTTLTWDKQWDGEIFNGSLPSGESFSDLERINFLETGAGINYRYQKHSRTYADFGISALHLFSPGQNFYNTQGVDLPRRITFSGVGNIKLVDAVDIQLHALQQLQGPYKETVFGGLGKFYVNQKRGKQMQLHVGLGYRTAGSLFPTLGVQYNNIYASLSYDVDTNDFNQILNSKRGGPEIHVRYIIANVKPLKQVKICPIF